MTGWDEAAMTSWKTRLHSSAGTGAGVTTYGRAFMDPPVIHVSVSNLSGATAVAGSGAFSHLNVVGATLSA